LPSRKGRRGDSGKRACFPTGKGEEKKKGEEQHNKKRELPDYNHVLPQKETLFFLSLFDEDFFAKGGARKRKEGNYFPFYSGKGEESESNKLLLWSIIQKVKIGVSHSRRGEGRKGKKEKPRTDSIHERGTGGGKRGGRSPIFSGLRYPFDFTRRERERKRDSGMQTYIYGGGEKKKKGGSSYLF